MWQIILGIIIVAITIRILSALKYVQKVSKLNVIPIERSLSFWFKGHLGLVLKDKPRSEIKFAFLHYVLNDLKDIEMPVVFAPGPMIMKRAILFMTDPVAIRECFSSRHMKDLHKGPEYNGALALIGHGILASNEEVWQKQRKICDLGFDISIIRSSVERSAIVTGLAIEKFKQMKNKNENKNGKIIINVPEEASLIASDVMGQVILGYDFNAVKADKPSEAPVYHSIRKLIDIIIVRLSRPALLPNPEFNRQLAVFNKLVDDVVEKEKIKKANPENSENSKNSENSENSEDSETSRKSNKTLMSYLLDGEYQGSRLTEEQVKDNVKTFMFAGQDTTASAIAWSLYYLAKLPHIQKKAIEEIDRVLGKDKQLTYEMVKTEFVYLNNFLKEMLRIRPSACFTKIAMNDLVLPGTDGKSFPVAQGVVMHFNPMLIHLNKKYWGEDAMECNPDRWINIDKDLSLIYFPFSQGHRNCIGQNFAKVEIVSVLAKFLQAFEVKLTPETESVPPRAMLELTVAPENYTLELIERK